MGIKAPARASIAGSGPSCYTAAAGHTSQRRTSSPLWTAVGRVWAVADRYAQGYRGIVGKAREGDFSSSEGL